MDWRGKPSLETKWLCDPIRSWALARGQGKALRGNHRIRFALPTLHSCCSVKNGLGRAGPEQREWVAGQKLILGRVDFYEHGKC